LESLELGDELDNIVEQVFWGATYTVQFKWGLFVGTATDTVEREHLTDTVECKHVLQLC
jgi:hypothetical protein